MVFFAQKLLRKVAGNWAFVVVTDRVELGDQIVKKFRATGAVSETKGDQCQARLFELNQEVLLEVVAGEEQAVWNDE